MADSQVLINQVDKVGIVKDTPAFTLPPGAWSDGNNIRFHNGSVSKMPGETNILSPLVNGSSIAVNPVHVNYWANPTTPQYVYCDNQHVFTMNSAGGIHYINKGSAAYSYSTDWHTSTFTGGYALIVNNTVDTPQYVIDTTSDGSVPALQDLPGFDYGTYSNTRTGILRSFGNVLIAGDLTTTVSGSEVKAPGTIRISNQAPAGSIPQTWDPFATTADVADEFELSDTSPVVEMVSIQGSMYVFTNSSIHNVGVTSSASTAAVVTRSYGALARDCAIEFDGQIMVVGSNDIYTFGGHPGSIRSVADGRVRSDFYKNLSPLHFKNTFILRNNEFDEIWIMYPDLDSSGSCNKALIWNYRSNTWTSRDIPNSFSGTVGPINGGGLDAQRIDFAGSGNTAATGQIVLGFTTTTDVTVVLNNRSIDQVIGDIASALNSSSSISVITDTTNDRVRFVTSNAGLTSDKLESISFTNGGSITAVLNTSDETTDLERPWGTTVFNPSREYLVLTSSNRLVAADVSFTKADGSSYTSFVEKKKTTFEDLMSLKEASKIYPLMEGAAIKITTSSSNAPGSSETFGLREYAFDPSQDYKIDTYCEGRLLDIKFEDTGSTEWRLTGFGLDLDLDGRR